MFSDSINLLQEKRKGKGEILEVTKLNSFSLFGGLADPVRT